jgi:hypothetical protein
MYCVKGGVRERHSRLLDTSVLLTLLCAHILGSVSFVHQFDKLCLALKEVDALKLPPTWAALSQQQRLDLFEIDSRFPQVKLTTHVMNDTLNLLHRQVALWRFAMAVEVALAEHSFFLSSKKVELTGAVVSLIN